MECHSVTAERIQFNRSGWRFVGSVACRLATDKHGTLMQEPVEVCAWARRPDAIRCTCEAAARIAVEFARERIAVLMALGQEVSSRLGSPACARGGG